MKINWEAAHLAAMRAPLAKERAHVALYNAVKLATAQGWHNDGYAHAYIIDLVRAARALLNMESGRIDCGSLDAFYVAVLKSCEVEE
jgi:hypothetical protein